MGAADFSAVTGRTDAGDRTAALHASHEAALLRYCRSRLPSREDAEDATQSVFLNVYRSLASGVEPRSDTAWIFKIAERVVLSRRRALARRARVELTTDAERLEGLTQRQSGEPGSDLFRLTDSLARMPDVQRRAILLHEWEGLPYRTIATELGVSAGAVETLVSRARRTLTDELQGGAPGPMRRRTLGLVWLIGPLSRYAHAGAIAKAAAGAASVTVLAVATSHVPLARIPTVSMPARGSSQADGALRLSQGREAPSPAGATFGARRAVTGDRQAAPGAPPSVPRSPIAAVAPTSPLDEAAASAAYPDPTLPATASAGAPAAAAGVARARPGDRRPPDRPAAADRPRGSHGHADPAPRLEASPQAPPDPADRPASSHEQAPPAPGSPGAGQAPAANAALPALPTGPGAQAGGGSDPEPPVADDRARRPVRAGS